VLRRSLFLLCLLLSCPFSASAKSLQVVASVGDLGAIAREVLGPDAKVTVLAKPTQDPHFVDARPNLMLDLNRADALCLMGLYYEVGWLPVLVRGSRNPGLQAGAPGYVDVSTMISAADIPRGPLDRSMGDIHPGGNPHFTRDPRNAVKIARGLAERFATLDPAGRAGYTKNADSFAKRLEAKIQEWDRIMSPHRGALVVTYHKSFVYLLNWLGLSEAGQIEPKPGIPPNPSYVAQLVGTMKTRHVRAVLQERWYPSSTGDLVSKSAGAKLVIIEGMTPIGGSYIEHMDHVVRAIVGGLS
jgi:zinc/manganese transport system substrate-binding protein